MLDCYQQQSYLLGKNSSTEWKALLHHHEINLGSQARRISHVAKQRGKSSWLSRKFRQVWQNSKQMLHQLRANDQITSKATPIVFWRWKSDYGWTRCIVLSMDYCWRKPNTHDWYCSSLLNLKRETFSNQKWRPRQSSHSFFLFSWVHAKQQRILFLRFQPTSRV